MREGDRREVPGSVGRVVLAMSVSGVWRGVPGGVGRVALAMSVSMAMSVARMSVLMAMSVSKSVWVGSRGGWMSRGVD